MVSMTRLQPHSLNSSCTTESDFLHLVCSKYILKTSRCEQTLNNFSPITGGGHRAACMDFHVVFLWLHDHPLCDLGREACFALALQMLCSVQAMACFLQSPKHNRRRFCSMLHSSIVYLYPLVLTSASQHTSDYVSWNSKEVSHPGSQGRSWGGAKPLRRRLRKAGEVARRCGVRQPYSIDR